MINLVLGQGAGDGLEFYLKSRLLIFYDDNEKLRDVIGGSKNRGCYI